MVTASRRTQARPAAECAEDFALAFREHGFVHVPGLFSEQEVSQFKEAAANVISAQGARDLVACQGSHCNDIDMLGVVALHPRLGAVAERLAGMPLRVWASTVLVKQPHGNPTSLHDDLPAEVLNSRISLNAWVALVDVPVERGCMTFLPGSHHREGPERVDITDFDMTDDKVDDAARSYLFTYWPDLRWSPRVTVPLRAGDVTFHHRRTAHAAGANESEDDRIAVQVVFTDADATYQPFGNRDPLPYQPGQALPDDRFPRVGATGTDQLRRGRGIGE